MHLVTLRFDRVYDVCKDPFRGNRTRTSFSFDANGKKYFSISVEGSPQLASGQTVTFALQQPDNWQTVCGMLIHDTGELCASSASLYVWLMLLAAFWAVIWYTQLKFDHPELVMPIVGAFGLAIAALAYGAYKAVQLRNALLRSRRTTSA